jgi:hypothetical protein
VSEKQAQVTLKGILPLAPAVRKNKIERILAKGGPAGSRPIA